MRDPSAATAPGGAPRRQPLALPRRVTGMRTPTPSRRRDMCGVQLRSAPVAGIKAVVAAGLFSAPLQRAAGAARLESEWEPPKAGRAAQHPQVSVMPAGTGACVPGAAGQRAVGTWVTGVVTRTSRDVGDACCHPCWPGTGLCAHVGLVQERGVCHADGWHPKIPSLGLPVWGVQAAPVLPDWALGTEVAACCEPGWAPWETAPGFSLGALSSSQRGRMEPLAWLPWLLRSWIKALLCWGMLCIPSFPTAPTAPGPVQDAAPGMQQHPEAFQGVSAPRYPAGHSGPTIPALSPRCQGTATRSDPPFPVSPVMNGSSHSPTAINGAPSTPNGFSNGPATSSSASLSTHQLPPACGARQLSKLKRFLTTLQQFGNDISPEIGERVRTLVLGLVVRPPARGQPRDPPHLRILGFLLGMEMLLKGKEWPRLT